MKTESKALNIALRTILARTRSAGGESAEQAVKDRLMASYSLIRNTGQKKH